MLDHWVTKDLGIAMKIQNKDTVKAMLLTNEDYHAVKRRFKAGGVNAMYIYVVQWQFDKTKECLMLLIDSTICVKSRICVAIHQ
jgi:3-deoxy-D-manno-octulosonate 8-phosphate phosphatase KdsC-like HAD superfamily phosphatase